MGKSKVTIKSIQEVEAVASMLSDLADSFKVGKAVFQKGTSFVILRPVGKIEVEIEAVEKKAKQKIKIQLSWREEILFKVPDVVTPVFIKMAMNTSQSG